MQARAIRCDNRRDLFADQRHGTIMDIRRIAIVGAGVIGASWAAFYLTQGFDVVATDPAPQADTRLRDALAAFRRPGRRTFRAAVVRRRSRACARRRRLRAGERPGAARPEARAVPADGRRAARARADRVGSSGLKMSDIQTACDKHPERCLIAHPFNPPHLIPLVELVGGDATSQDVIARVKDFYDALGKQTIVLNKEMTGHVANRLAAAVPRGVSPRRRRRGERGRCGQGRRMGPGLRWG